MRTMIFTALGFALTVPPALHGQVVRGVVLEDGNGDPVAGAMVILIEAGGDVVDRVLSDAAGGFAADATHPGRFEIRVDRIGYASMTTDPFDVPPEGTFRTVSVPIRPIELLGLDVAGSRRCEVRPEEGRVTARVWEEARKALAAAAWTQSTGLYRYTLLHYVRDLDRDAEEIESERRTFMRGSTRAPFVSLSAEQLRSEGFVHENNDGVIYHAPDADALLSDAFLDTHCMGVRRGEDGRIGLVFEPIDGRDLPEIEGVLWLDERTAKLDRVEFEYVNLRRSDGAGGEVVFTALPDGTWIVREFRIRMPAFEHGGFTGLRRVGYRDEGGLAWRISDRSGRIVLEASTATVSGTVVDSVGAPPDPPARVRVDGLDTESVTAEDGSFLIPGLAAGLYRLLARHASLDTLGLAAAPVEARTALGEIVPIALTLPTPAQALDQACGGGERPAGTTIVLGRLLRRNGVPTDSADVRVSWVLSPSYEPPTLAGPKGPDGEAELAWKVGVEGAYQILETRTDARGIFLLCDVPAESSVRVEAWKGRSARTEQLVPVPPGRDLVMVTMTIQEGEEP